MAGLASNRATPERLAVLAYVAARETLGAPPLCLTRHAWLASHRYCFVLARSGAMANFLVNSAIMTLWVRMVGQRKCPMSIRARVALVMGAAVRHATFISVSLQGDRVRCGTGLLPRCIR